MLSVALCTYNGEKYIEEQLQSIAHQTYLPDELIIFDDLSTDNTITIINNFINTVSFNVKLIKNKKNNGTVKNFFEAINACSGDYIALCDQDDVWCKDKLYRSMQFIKTKKLSPDIPMLAYTDLYVADEKLKIVSKSMMKNQKIKNEIDMECALKVLLVQNYITGCTIILNKSLKKYIGPFNNNIIMHDWWLGLLAAIYGEIIYIDEPLIYYRQHGKNQVGARKYFSYSNIKKLMSKRKICNQIINTIKQVKILETNIKSNGIRNKTIRNYLEYIKSGDIYKIYKLQIGKQGYLRNFFFYIFLFCLKKKLKKI